MGYVTGQATGQSVSQITGQATGQITGQVAGWRDYWAPPPGNGCHEPCVRASVSQSLPSTM